MAKALLGHLGGSDVRMTMEVRRLQQRVKDLEAQVLSLQAENDALAAAAGRDAVLSIEAEHAALAGTTA